MKRTVIILSFIFALAIALSASIPTLAATDTKTTTITGTLGGAIEVTAPGDFVIGTLTPDQLTNSSVKTVTVKCNKAWSLTVADKRGSPVLAGHMDDGTHALTNALTVKGGDQSGYTALSATPVTLKASGNPGVNSINDIYFQQDTEWTDDASVGSYTITVTFTTTW
jgi:hypothetical protein